MARRCGCASETCSCFIAPTGEGIAVSGAGTPTNPFVINSTLDIDTGVDVQVNNVTVAPDVHGLDFRGAGVTVTPGADEVIVTIPGPTATTNVPVPAGTMWMFGGVVAPSGWLLCDGSSQSVAALPDLFAAIGNRYGGDGISTFFVPNLQDRVPMGASGTKPVGQTGGAASRTIGIANLPPHAHSINHDHAAFNSGTGGAHSHSTGRRETSGAANDAFGRGGGSALSRLATDSESSHVHSINVPAFSGNSGSVGSGTPLDTQPPYVALTYIIKT